MREMITFVVPAYNAEATLERTIESILHQTDERYKIIIVNDGSTDGTDRICQDYAKSRMDKIAYIKQENRGLGGARNRGMDAVTTAYVSFLDSDDWLMPEYVENINKQLEQHTPQMIMTLPQIYHEGSKVVKDWYDKTLFEQIFREDGAMINPQEELRIYQFEMNLCRKVLRMDFLKEIQFCFRERIKWEDVYPHFYLLSKCQRCMGVGSVGFYYRIGGTGQITASRGKDRLDLLTVFGDLLQFMECEKKEELYFPVMRVMVRFSIWCIRMTDMETRIYLVKELHKIFKSLPGEYYKALRKGSRDSYSKADARQYQLFMVGIRYRICNLIFYDYLYQDMGEKFIKRILKAGKRVA